MKSVQVTFTQSKPILSNEIKNDNPINMPFGGHFVALLKSVTLKLQRLFSFKVSN